MDKKNGAQYATKQDLKNTVESTKNELLDKLSRKEELKQEVAKLATKEELKQEVAKLATKEELNQAVAKLSTKDELKKLEVRFERLENQVVTNTGSINGLKKEVSFNSTRIDALTKEIVSLRSDMTLLETKADADKKFHALMNAIEGLAAKLDDYKVEKAATDHTLLRYGKQLENHEKRITNLEAQ